MYPFQLRMFILLLQDSLTVELPINRMECFFANVETPSELQGQYRLETNDSIALSFKISANRDANLFDSVKSVDTFSIQARTPSVYRFCFSSLNKDKQRANATANLFFELDTIELKRDTTSFGSLITATENEMTQIENNYRSQRNQEQQLNTKITSGIWKMWIWLAVEIGVCVVLFGMESLWMVKETK